MLPTPPESQRIRKVVRTKTPPPVVSPGFELYTAIPTMARMPSDKSIIEVRDCIIKHLVNVTNLNQPDTLAQAVAVGMPPEAPQDPLRHPTKKQLEAKENPESRMVVIRSRPVKRAPHVIHVQSTINVNHGTFTIKAFYRHGPNIMLQQRGRTEVVATTVVFHMDKDSSNAGVASYSFNDNAVVKTVPNRQTWEEGRVSFAIKDVREVLRMIEFY